MRSPTLFELPPPPEAETVWPWTRASAPLPAVMPGGSPWPLISIVIPSFNNGAYLEHAIRSVLLQGYPRLELIVMDGGSTDGTFQVIEKYESWLKHWVSRRDRGPAAALTAGFGYASGDILGFLNADDFYLADALGTVARCFARAPSADVLSGHGHFATATGDLGAPMFSDRWSRTRFRYGACVLLQPATFFRRAAYERVGGFRDSGRLCWDMELWADLARTGASFGTMAAFLAAFRLHANSMTASPEHQRRRRDDARAVMAEMRGRPESIPDRLLHSCWRTFKFVQNPGRSLRCRVFVYRTLERWTL